MLKAHVDAMWARLAEENAKREKSERERLQQITALLSNFINKDMPAVLERGLRKEFSALIPAVSQAILPPLQKAVSSVINETFQVHIFLRNINLLCSVYLGSFFVQGWSSGDAYYPCGMYRYMTCSRFHYTGFFVCCG